MLFANSTASSGPSTSKTVVMAPKISSWKMSICGVTAGIITEDRARGLSVAKRLKTGIVHVNDQSVADEPQAPFGGIQESGYGKFGGLAGVESFSERRWVTVQDEGHAQFPF